MESSTMMGFGAGLGFGFGGILALLGCVLVLAGIVVLVAWAIGRVGGPTPATQAQVPGPPANDALEILRLRFARGEMTADEYTAARQVLEAGR
jgi:uncharacterized membrane protein